MSANKGGWKSVRNLILFDSVAQVYGHWKGVVSRAAR